MKTNRKESVAAAPIRPIDGTQVGELVQQYQDLKRTAPANGLIKPTSPFARKLLAANLALSKLAKDDSGLLTALDIWDLYGQWVTPKTERPKTLDRRVNGMKIDTIRRAMKTADWFYVEARTPDDRKFAYEMIVVLKKTLHRLCETDQGLSVAKDLWQRYVPEGAERRPHFMERKEGFSQHPEQPSSTSVRNVLPWSAEEIQAMKDQYTEQLQVLYQGPSNIKRYGGVQR